MIHGFISDWESKKQSILLEITWSDGKKEIYKNIACNRYITILQGKGIINEFECLNPECLKSDSICNPESLYHCRH